MNLFYLKKFITIVYILGFLKALDGKLQEFTLLQLTQSSAIGAAICCTKKINFELPIDFSQNYSVLYHHQSE